MAFGIHLSSWSAFKKQNVTTGGKLKTKALKAAKGIVKSHINKLSIIAGYLVFPPPATMPNAAGY